MFPKIEQRLPLYLTEHEIQNLLATANQDQSEKGIRNKVMLYVMYATGMRVTELVTLTISQIHFDTGFVKLSGKGNKDRVIPLPKNVLELLRFYLNHIHHRLMSQLERKKTQKQQYLFLTQYGKKTKPL